MNVASPPDQLALDLRRALADLLFEVRNFRLRMRRWRPNDYNEHE
jgi:hypothetical protein